MKKFVIIAITAIILLVVFGTVWKLGQSSKKESAEILPTPTVALPTVPDSVSVSLTPKNGNKAIKLSVSGLNADIETVEYEITYTTGAGLPRGVLGKITTNGQSQISRDDIVLGTCSSGKCVYDSGVNSVELTLKFNSSSGSSSVFNKSYPLSNE
jgi:hypothetical protein